MIHDDELESALAAGVIDAATASALRAHVQALRASPAPDEEHFRLLTGFNDIFVVIAASLLLGAVAWLGASLAPWLGGAATAAVSWGLAEYFVRKRRMALPAIMLLGSFVGGCFFAALYVGAPLGESPWDSRTPWAALAAAGAAWLHWRRFAVPITVAAATGVVALAAISAVRQAMPEAREVLYPMMCGAGLLAFAFALRWDASDRARQTRRADVAFWLHLLAAPLIVHPVFQWMGISTLETGPGRTLLVLALYLLLGFVSLAIDRRALMVSALGYVVYAFATMLRQWGEVGTAMAVTALCVGAALLLLSAWWQASRGWVLGRLPARLQALLPPAAG